MKVDAIYHIKSLSNEVDDESICVAVQLVTMNSNFDPIFIKARKEDEMRCWHVAYFNDTPVTITIEVPE